MSEKAYIEASGDLSVLWPITFLCESCRSPKSQSTESSPLVSMLSYVCTDLEESVKCRGIRGGG